MIVFLTLLKKDWRVNLALLVGTVVLLAVTFGCCISEMGMERPERRSVAMLADRVVNGCVLGVFMMVLMSAAYGGVAFALERRERSAEFLAMMPVGRGANVASKLLVAVGSVAAVDLLLCTGTVLAWPFTAEQPIALWANLDTPVLIGLALQVMAYGVGWLLSTFLNGPTLPACIAIAATVGTPVMLSLYMSAHAGELEAGRQTDWYLWHCTITGLAVGITALVAGTVYYGRRVEP